MPQSYELHIISVSGIQWKPDLLSLHRETPNLYVAIDVDGKLVHRSSAKRAWVGLWNDLAPLSAESPSSVITLEVFSKRSMKKDKCMAKTKMEIGVLFEKCNTQKDFHIQLDHVKENVTEKPELVVRMNTIGRAQAGTIALANATQDSEPLKSGAAGSAVKLLNHGAEHADLASTLKTLVGRLDIVVQMGAELAKIHPYSNAAYKVLTSVYEAVKEQDEKDEKVIKLVQTMTDAYSFVEDVEVLPDKIKRLEDIISALVKQTEECALFIREYTGHGFCGRVLTGLFSEQTEKIQDFVAAFIKLQESLDTALVVHTASVSTKTQEIVKGLVFVSTKTQKMIVGLAQSDKLKSLGAIDMNASLRTGCLAGTRQDLLSIITNWLTTPSDAKNPSNILWLHGVAGAGKSAIATSVSEHFGELKRLGAFLFFNRNKSSPHSVIRTIAYQLARSNSYIAAAICAVIDEDPGVVDTPMQTQFEKLLLQPLKDAEKNIPGPIIVILDALDECGDAQSRRGLVSILSNEFPKLPVAFRFFITSRHDSDIAVKFEAQPRITKHLLDISLPSSLKDIRLYIDSQLIEIRQQQSLDPTWPGESKTKALAAYSSGLFIWASTAMEWLLEAHKPKKILDSLLEKGRNLDDLYAETLQSTGLWNDKSTEEDTQASIQDAQAALSAVVLGKVPMTDATVDALLNLGPECSSSHIFIKLGCVLQWSPGQIVRVLHASFTDYLTDSKRSGGKPWCMNLAGLECQLARGCLRILNGPEGLRFNICQLKDSHIRNSDVQDITTHIPPALSYSSLFWASHLQRADSDNERNDSESSDMKNALLTDIKNLMYSKFLFWLEVLGLLQEIPIAIDALTAVSKLAMNHDEELADFVIDAVKFVTAFAPAITLSVAHIYLSAMPLAPRESRVANKFSKWFVQKVDIQSSLGVQWPRLQITMEGHSRSVRSVSFSPHGERIVSGSGDSTIRVWDASTGALAAGPFTGHHDEVYSVAFSPDGENIVSGSGDSTVCIWDAHTGVLIAGPYEGHNDSVFSVSFSPDGRRIVSGSADHRVLVWDVRNVDLVSAFSGHAGSVYSVAFSPQGDRIVSGSADTTIQVWNAETGARSTGLLEGHDGDVNSVAFSLYGDKIVSGSDDRTIRVWDASTGSLIAGPFTGHTDIVVSVAFSLNGEHIVSGSLDRTVRVWDARTGAHVSSPFEEHSDGVVSVSFSPDGGQIVSGSTDHTVRIWDAHLDSTVALEYIKPTSDANQIRHSSDIDSIAFSPDGDRIVSGSKDRTIRVWDAHTGSLVAGPFTGHTHWVLSVAFSLNGEHILSGSRDGTVRIWDARTGTLVVDPFDAGDDWVRQVSFTPDGKHVAACGDDSTLWVWDAQTATLVSRAFEGDKNTVKLSLAFSPDREHIVEGARDGTIRVWEAQTGALVYGPFEGHAGKIKRLASSPDGGQVVSGSSDSVVRVWNTHTGSLIPVLLQGHSRDIESVTFSRDGKWIASGSLDRTICVWDAQTGIVTSGPFAGPSAAISTVDFSPDGGRVACGSKDGTIRVYEINTTSAPHQPFGDGLTLKDGWILNSTSQLILWIPPWLRKGLYFPHNSLIISRDGTTKLDFSRFVHGTSWEECIDVKVRG